MFSATLLFSIMRSPIEPSPLPKSVDIAIVGAGPQALTLVTHLLQKKKTMRNRDPQLRWAGCNLFILGGAAALQLGPVARNLFGARLASERIVPALIKQDSRHY
ncbi:MAG: hypothetical protein VKK04_06845 [Synechococcales bacterium]|nr:hypothetical protein [Synechococcales bacterium]